MDDLIRKQDLPQSEGGPTVFIHFASHAGDAHHGYLDDDLDGLPDEWETGAIKPGGLDLKALGCKPGAPMSSSSSSASTPSTCRCSRPRSP